MRDVEWQRSSRCESGNCVEVGRRPGAVVVRDSLTVNGPVLTFTPAEWKQFVEGVRAGEFDIR